jgi:hypothetical protein
MRVGGGVKTPKSRAGELHGYHRDPGREGV